MMKVGKAVGEFRNIDQVSRRDGFVRRIHPLVKLCFVLCFLILIISRNPYDLRGIIILAICPIVIMILDDISLINGIKRFGIIIPFIALMGILEPFFNRAPIDLGNGIVVPGGVVTGLTLVLKGCLSVFMAYILIATTPIEEICYGLRLIHVPKTLVIVILLTYRYIGILMSEGKRVITAYSLRAPGQKGIAFKAWGSLLGQLLLRSMDRAENLYESMQLRGFNGEFYIKGNNREKGK